MSTRLRFRRVSCSARIRGSRASTSTSHDASAVLTNDQVLGIGGTHRALYLHLEFDVRRHLSPEFDELMRRIVEEKRRLEVLLARCRQQIRRSEQFLALNSLRPATSSDGSPNK